jgi:hypothetical protein
VVLGAAKSGASLAAIGDTAEPLSERSWLRRWRCFKWFSGLDHDLSATL